MPQGYSETTITGYDVENDLPFDDFSLAYHLGMRNKVLWYTIVAPVKDRYHVFKIPKKKGGFRTIHAPEPLMKALMKILNKTFLEPLHRQLGGHVTAYRTGQSIKDAVARHIAPCLVCDNNGDPSYTPPKHRCPRRGAYIQIDLQDFFSTTSKSKVRNYFKSLGYPHETASLLGGMFTVSGIPNSHYVPGSTAPPYFCGVPQGNPTAGSICNLVADRVLDIPMLQLLESMNQQYGLEGAYRWVYSRYADDLSFTCGRDFPLPEKERILWRLYQVIYAAGYQPNTGKTKTHSENFRKQMLGLVFNQRPNIARHDYLQIKAIVHNCFVWGADTQYERAGFNDVQTFITWLKGKLNYYRHIMPTKGAKLAKELELALDHGKTLLDSSDGGERISTSPGLFD